MKSFQELFTPEPKGEKRFYKIHDPVKVSKADPKDKAIDDKEFDASNVSTFDRKKFRYGAEPHKNTHGNVCDDGAYEDDEEIKNEAEKLGALSSATLKRDAKILRGDRKDFEHKYNKDAVNKAAGGKASKATHRLLKGRHEGVEQLDEATEKKGHYWDTMSGLVGVKVHGIKPHESLPHTSVAHIEVTSHNHSVYKKGEHHHNIPTHHIVPKSAVHVKNGMYRIWPHKPITEEFLYETHAIYDSDIKKIVAKYDEEGAKTAVRVTNFAHWAKTGVHDRYKILEMPKPNMDKKKVYLGERSQKSLSEADEKYWTYKASSPTPHVSQLPAGAFKGSQDDFSRLSPGMRREIQRQAERDAAKKKNIKEARGPLEGHPYHSKTDAELHYIIKDASAAAKAMRGHSPSSGSKYLDQMNDALTVLAHRRRMDRPWTRKN